MFVLYVVCLFVAAAARLVCRGVHVSVVPLPSQLFPEIGLIVLVFASAAASAVAWLQRCHLHVLYVLLYFSGVIY